MIGGICGDVIGSRLEFGHKTISPEFELLTEKNTFTDDTVFLIAMMDCVKNYSKNYKGYLINWCEKYPQVGYGANFETWLKSETKESYGSKGNGCLVRIIPMACLFKGEINKLDKEVEKIINFTHDSDDSFRWSKAVARTIYLARRGYSAGKILKDVEEVLDGIEFRNIYNITNKRSELAKDIAPYAIITGLMAESFESGIRDIVCRNIDNDTGAAIVGAIMEARGIVPDKSLKNKIMKILPDEMKQVVREFYRSGEWKL